MKNKYRVQTRIANPEAVREHSGKTHRWIDSSEHARLADAKAARRPDQRVIRIMARGEGALFIQATEPYRGRRFNIEVAATACKHGVIGICERCEYENDLASMPGLNRVGGAE